MIAVEKNNGEYLNKIKEREEITLINLQNLMDSFMTAGLFWQSIIILKNRSAI